MIEFLHNIADDDNGSPIVPLIFLALVVISSLIGALSKAATKSRQRREQQQRGAGLGTPSGAAERRPTVDQFLEQIRRMAAGQAGPGEPAAGPEPKPQGPLQRPAPPPPPKPVQPLQARGTPGAPPPPPRPMVRRPAAARPIPRPATLPRPAQPSVRPPRPVEPAPLPAAEPVSRPPEPAVTARPRDAMEQLAALAERPQQPPAAAPPKRRLKPKPKLAEKAAKPVPVAARVGPSALKAAMRQRLMAGPQALREAILLGEIVGQPISMRRHHMRRPGSVGRLI